MGKKLRKLLNQKMPGSEKLHCRARQSLANFYTTGPFGLPQHIVYIREANGSHIIDVDGNEYVDMFMAAGAVFLGHAAQAPAMAAQQAMQHGVVLGFGHEYEVELAEQIRACLPWIEKISFTNSGTEATMHAIKIARALTGKECIAKFEGAFHGVHDYAQISGRWTAAGPPETPESRRSFAGIPAAIEDLVLTFSYGYPQTFEQIRAHAANLAAVIVEPVPTVCPIDFREFLQELRQVTQECGRPAYF